MFRLLLYSHLQVELTMSYRVQDFVLRVINVRYDLRINVNGISNVKKKVIRLKVISNKI